MWLVKARDLAGLEDNHGPGLFFENVRGWKGLGPARTTRRSTRRSAGRCSRRPERCSPATTGSCFARAASTRTAKLTLYDASIVNGRQTTGVLAEVRDRLDPDCMVAVKVVEAEGDAWPIAEAANNQNTVARIDLRLSRYFREQLVQRELASAAGGDEWLTDVMEPLNAREETFDHLRYLFIGLFCRRPNQLAEDNYSQLRWDVLSAYFRNGEPPADLYPTLHKVARATDEALHFVESWARATRWPRCTRTTGRSTVLTWVC